MNLQRLSDTIIDGIRRNKFILTYIDGDNFTANFAHRDDVALTIQFRETTQNGYLLPEFCNNYGISETKRAIIEFKFNGQTFFIEKCYVAYDEEGINSFILPERVDVCNVIEEEKDILFEQLNRSIMFDFESYDEVLNCEDFEIAVDEWRLV